MTEVETLVRPNPWGKAKRAGAKEMVETTAHVQEPSGFID